MAGGGRDATGHVIGQDGRSKERKDPWVVRPKGDVIPLRKAGNVFVIDPCVTKDATSRMLGFHWQA